MYRNLDREAAIIINDMSSMAHRVEMLQANQHYTNALVSIQNALSEIEAGRAEIHQREMAKSFAEDCKTRRES